ncbi:hypothetical protein Ana3638_04605 [Anaerocolumna sedimenticola]|uniref:Uncharacterized protein n=1 Tax=Anaerocolumna sedimenticola TaxID=2696063 RepID=A0A6P1TG28_9FIRM|nr:hypothetical protein [Anaerocolumna sedimenticola]QHQ60150.1 hypothetical protein Ana3638_04605 [Anaerocolumna sedimenticola]
MDKINGQNYNKSIYIQNTGAKEKEQNKQEEVNNKQGKSGDTIFAGNLQLGETDILSKKDHMKKNAIKVLLSAFTGEQKIDENIESHQDNVKALEKEAKEAQDELNRIDNLKQDLQKTCNIDPESDEQKDLELLEKQKDCAKGLGDTPLTEEEKQRIENMGPLTEYQKAALKYHDMELTWRERLNDAKNSITGEHMTIEGIQLAKLKTHPMVDAGKESDKMLEAAGKEAISGLYDEAKENIDDKIEEDKDKAEEIKEKEKEEKEKLEKAADDKKAAQKAKDNRDDTSIEQAQKNDADWDKIHREIQAMADKEKLLTEDIKGLTVDEQV